MNSINNKGSANMWWIIIGAVMALVVMIILMVIFSGGTEKANTGLFDCASKGGSCITSSQCKTEGGTVSVVFSCPKNADTSIEKGEGLTCCFTEKK